MFSTSSRTTTGEKKKTTTKRYCNPFIVGSWVDVKLFCCRLPFILICFCSSSLCGHLATFSRLFVLFQVVLEIRNFNPFDCFTRKFKSDNSNENSWLIYFLQVHWWRSDFLSKLENRCGFLALIRKSKFVCFFNFISWLKISSWRQCLDHFFEGF